jgi:hypothetical protein
MDQEHRSGLTGSKRRMRLSFMEQVVRTLDDLMQRRRRRREDRQTWNALRHLDDRQLRELGLPSRPADLVRRDFP